VKAIEEQEWLARLHFAVLLQLQETKHSTRIVISSS